MAMSNKRKLEEQGGPPQKRPGVGQPAPGPHAPLRQSAGLTAGQYLSTAAGPGVPPGIAAPTAADQYAAQPPPRQLSPQHAPPGANGFASFSPGAVEVVPSSGLNGELVAEHADMPNSVLHCRLGHFDRISNVESFFVLQVRCA